MVLGLDAFSEKYSIVKKTSVIIFNLFQVILVTTTLLVDTNVVPSSTLCLFSQWKYGFVGEEISGFVYCVLLYQRLELHHNIFYQSSHLY